MQSTTHQLETKSNARRLYAALCALTILALVGLAAYWCWLSTLEDITSGPVARAGILPRPVGTRRLSVARYTMKRIGTPGERFFHEGDINNKGQVVGGVETRKDTWRAFLWESGRRQDLNRTAE